jgi:hypothetical protein
MAGRPAKNRPEETAVDETGIEYFDKCLCSVKREFSGKNIVTKSVTVTKIEKAKIPGMQITMDALNATVEHQNPTENQMPMVIWYFKHGTVKQGEELKANDIIATYVDEETEKEIRITNHDGTWKVIGLHVTDKKITAWEPGKRAGTTVPVYAESEA